MSVGLITCERSVPFGITCSHPFRWPCRSQCSTPMRQQCSFFRDSSMWRLEPCSGADAEQLTIKLMSDCHTCSNHNIYIYITSSYYFILLMHFLGIWPLLFGTAKPWLQVQNLWLTCDIISIIPSLGSPSVRRSPQPKFLFHHVSPLSKHIGGSGSWHVMTFFPRSSLQRWHMMTRSEMSSRWR